VYEYTHVWLVSDAESGKCHILAVNGTLMVTLVRIKVRQIGVACSVDIAAIYMAVEADVALVRLETNLTDSDSAQQHMPILYIVQIGIVDEARLAE